jgi:uncharacterized damage-inducible protein DinB
MRLFRSIVLSIFFAAPLTLLAQGNPVANAVRESARDNGKNLLAAAEAMPADKYGYKPTPAQMTFGELIVHIQGDNRITCSAIGGSQPAAEATLAPTDPKEKLVSALQRSLAICDAALAQVKDSQLGDAVSYYGHSASRATALIGLITDWADHYSQQAIYLRLNGVLPPTAR